MGVGVGGVSQGVCGGDGGCKRPAEAAQRSRQGHASRGAAALGALLGPLLVGDGGVVVVLERAVGEPLLAEARRLPDLGEGLAGGACRGTRATGRTPRRRRGGCPAARRSRRCRRGRWRPAPSAPPAPRSRRGAPFRGPSWCCRCFVRRLEPAMGVSDRGPFHA